jgi:putative transposase
MKQIPYSEEQIIGISKEHDAGVKTADLCRRHGMSPATFYKWKSKFGGMEISDAKRLRALEAENANLKHLVVGLTLDKKALRDVLSKKW